MTDLYWPGDQRAGELMADGAFLAAMVDVERAWLAALVHAGIAPAAARDALTELVAPADASEIATAAESGGNPAIPLVSLLRNRVRERNGAAASWLHRGLTSQDVIDTALVLCVREAAREIDRQARLQAAALLRLCEQYGDAPMVGRTLTQHAVPTTFGVRAAAWLDGIIDAATRLRAETDELPAQIGGAVGTLAAVTELLRLRGLNAEGVDDPESAAVTVAGDAARRLGLRARRAWHTTRLPLTSVADALVGYTDALGHLAADVAVSSRPEIGELTEPAAEGRGGSSTMPHKHNPVLSVLIRRAAIAAPMLGATMHSAAAATLDDRPDGAWHVEWATLRTLTRHTVVAASESAELLDGLVVHRDKLDENLRGSIPDTLAEQRSMAALIAEDSGAKQDSGERYLGVSAAIVRGATARAHAFLKEET